MSGSSRQTGTVPKTKHNTRSRRENPVNHIPNNLDWHDTYTSQRTRKESNTASRLSDHGDEYEENPWIGLPQQRNESEEVRWHNVKSSNLTPERSGSLTNVDSLVTSLPSCSTSRRQENSSLEEPSTSKEAEKRLKQKIELSQRKIDELQQQQAAYLSLRNKAIQQVKPVQVEEIHQNSPMGPLRNKAIQQVKPVQQGDLDQMANLERRLQSIQEYTNLIHAIEHDDSMLANFEGGSDCPMEQQLRSKLQELIDKKARMDNLLAYFESNKIIDGTRSVSSEEGDSSGTSYLRQYLLEQTDSSKRDSNKQDNRENTSSYTPTRETRLEGLRVKLDQLLDWMSRIENQNLNGPKTSASRVNGDGASSQLLDVPPGQNKILQPSRDKPQQAKKLCLDNQPRRPKSTPERTNGLSISNMESWSIRSNMSSASHNQAPSSSDEGEYDESPVKLCPPNLSLPHQFGYGKPFGSFGSGLENTFATPISLAEKCLPPQVKATRAEGVSRSECDGAMEGGRPNMVGSSGRTPPRPGVQSRAYPPHPPPPPPPDAATMALHLSQLQEQMQAVYEGLVEKLAAYHAPPPPPPAPWLGASSLGYLQFMNPSSQWHQHQLLISSLNQCCQLIWHQQREIAGLRQALNMVQRGEERVCDDGCQAYGHNLNPGLLWQPPLNNQVAPGNRANNYWDNFRSYSRQNLLSARNKSNERGRPATVSQADNLRRVENSCSTNTRTSRNGENFCDPNYFGAREINMNKIKHEHGNDAFSLEQSVYSELESVIMHPDRSPDLLLQLLTQLKTIKSQQAQSQEGGVFEESSVFDAATPGCSRQTNPVEPKPASSHQLYDTKNVILDEVTKLITGGTAHQICTPEFLQRLVELTSRTLHHHDSAQTSLEASLLKFQGARLSQVAEELLCLIANVLSHHYPNDSSDIQAEVEEGGSCGVCVPVAPLSLHHHVQLASPQSVETELAEADQRSSSDNAPVFDSHEMESYNDEPESREQSHGRDESASTSESTTLHDSNQPKD